MKCWKENCKDEVKFICQCINPKIYSCGIHLLEHLTIASGGEHRPESVTILPNPATKKTLIDHLHKSLSSLYEFRLKTISDLSTQINLLNEKMKITLNSFKEIIQKHREAISQISSLEIISKLNNSKINELMKLTPEESVKKLGEILGIFDRSKLFINDEGKIEVKQEPNQIVVFRDSTMKIVKVNLDNYLSSEIDISLDNNKDKYTSMCLIPENSVFCYGNWPVSATAFIIDSSNRVNQVINAPAALGSPGLIYYKDYVFIFGGYTNGPASNSFKYDMKNKNWINMNSLPTPSQLISCIVRKNKILLSGYNHSKIYCYDITQNSYAELHNTISNYRKIICGSKMNYYVIETGRNIYESNAEWKVWNTIGDSGIINGNRIGFNVLWQNKVYFVWEDYNLYEFDLKEKKIKLIKKI